MSTSDFPASHAQAACPTEQRIEVLDGIRGLALLLILLINTLYFSGQHHDGVAPANAADIAARWLLSILVEQKGVGLFALLFGAGVALQVARVGEAGRGRLIRRFVALMAFGLAHFFLLWSGDILRFLALVGVILLVFARAPESSLRNSIYMLMVFPAVLLMLLIALGGALPEPSPHESAGVVAEVEHETSDELPASLVGSYADVVKARAAHWLPGFSRVFMPGGLIYLLGMGLCGMYAVRRRWHLAIRDQRPWGARYHLLVTGLITGLVYAWARWQGDGLSDEVQTIVLAITGYASGGALACFFAIVCVQRWEVTRATTRLRLLAPAGRMALTNYLLQSLVMTSVMYGYGLGLMGNVGAAAASGLALVLYALQAAASAWWLRGFRFGPAEWLWRCITYGELQPLRR